MKRIILLLISTISVLPVFGQVRLVARCSYGWTPSTGYTKGDSTTYTYSGNREGDPDKGDCLYDTSIQYKTYMGSTDRFTQYTRMYNDSDKVTVQTVASWVSNDWSYNIRQMYAWYDKTRYDSTTTDRWNKVVNNWDNDFRYKYYYTGTRIDSVLHRRLISGIWEIIARELYTYAGGNLTAKYLLTIDVPTRNWDTTQKEIRTYDIGNHVINILYHGTSSTDQQEDFTYDSKGRIAEHRYSSWSLVAAAWVNTYQYFYTYTPDDRIDLTTMNIWDAVAQKWGPANKDQYTYDAQGHNTMIVHKTSGPAGYVNYRMVTRYYNADGLLTIEGTHDWDASTSSWILYNVVYYYYAAPTNLLKVKKAKKTMQLFPNPAAGDVHMTIGWQQAVPFHISIYDAQGKVVYTKAEGPAINYTAVLPVGTLPAGVYQVRAVSTNKEMTEQLIIGHQ